MRNVDPIFIFFQQSELDSADPRDKTACRSPEIPGPISERLQIPRRKRTQENEIKLDTANSEGECNTSIVSTSVN